jgi:hypothetical protein
MKARIRRRSRGLVTIASPEAESSIEVVEENMIMVEGAGSIVLRRREPRSALVRSGQILSK